MKKEEIEGLKIWAESHKPVCYGTDNEDLACAECKYLSDCTLELIAKRQSENE